jgi:hypothetical protein
MLLEVDRFKDARKRSSEVFSHGAALAAEARRSWAMSRAKHEGKRGGLMLCAFVILVVCLTTSSSQACRVKMVEQCMPLAPSADTRKPSRTHFRIFLSLHMHAKLHLALTHHTCLREFISASLLSCTYRRRWACA